jgi:AraC-like DNA-binding protein
MKRILTIETIDQYNNGVNQKTFHPLVSIVDFSKAKPRRRDMEESALSFKFYCVFLKDDKNCIIRYGRNNYDYQKGTLVFIAPDQVVSIEEDEEYYQPKGSALLFHPDLIRGTSLGNNFNDYTFFNYDVHEALHLSEDEKQIVMDCFSKINFEIRRSIDKHSKRLIVSNIELFLNYCIRFYERQFITREHVNSGILEKFENLLNEYFRSDRPQLIGIPTVSYFADVIHLSPNYFGDLVKKDTGKTAQEHIQIKMIEIAKNKIADHSKTISEVGYELGFKYPQHFTRFFKQQAGCTPNEFKGSLN